MKLIRFVVWGLFFIFGAAFILTLHLRPYPYHYLVKSIPIFSLAVLVFTHVRGIDGKLFGLGFLFSAAGDIALELPLGVSFLIGMGLFFIAHLFYISVLLRKPELSQRAKLVITGLIAYGVLIGILLEARAGTLFLPVAAYLLIIIVMASSAALGRENHPILIAGALLFIVSDSLIAINRFITPVFLSSLWVMLTYYSAQALLARGIMLVMLGSDQAKSP